MNSYILIALTDQLLLTEAAHAAAAATSAQQLEVKTSADPRDIARYAPKASAIVVDASTAAHVGAQAPAAPVYFLTPDPGPIEYEAALACHAQECFLVPAQSPQLLEALAATNTPGVAAASASQVLAVTGTAGGLGASTLAVSLSCALAPAALVDARAGAGGIDLLVGLEQTPGLRWPDLNIGAGKVDGADIHAVLPVSAGGVAVLSHARSTVDDPFELPTSALAACTTALSYHHPVVVDGMDVAPFSPDHVVVLTAAEVRAAAAAAGVVATLRARGINHSLVLRHRGWSSLSTAEVEDVVSTDVVAEIPTLRRLPRLVEEAGLNPPLPRRLQQACDLVLANAGWA
ncbi:hypothetical protein CPHO_01170 [Corynebacterium phocae]|uniref:Rv3660c-like CheY-like N-terminal domain-containing protein n=1 Tax=Corynebacterium phocae TaxID=161895 RepID=A0A1L7D153_9CORY|nr:septum site-determining protein Ssd [Corynebacterium phocae]APT91762.1 hypothetical protein CPHO_01170 [Corynebacterium phocae]KAA8728525.1 septum formation initiator [Corynebacterium phocae]